MLGKEHPLAISLPKHTVTDARRSSLRPAAPTSRRLTVGRLEVLASLECRHREESTVTLTRKTRLVSRWKDLSRVRLRKVKTISRIRLSLRYLV